MRLIDNTVTRLDNFQRRHKLFHFGVNVVNKYSRDEGGKLVALITYYGFMSLFPLLLVLTTAAQIFLKNHDELRVQLAKSISHYFPVFSNELNNNIHTLHQTGLALIIALLLTIYGARGGAESICYAFNRIWKVPKERQLGFPGSLFRDLKLVAWAGGGLIVAAVLSSYAAGIINSFGAKVVAFAVSFVVLTGVFFISSKIIVEPRSRHNNGLFISAALSAIGIQVLLSIGGYYLTHQLKHLTTLYGAFAVVLGLILWIYLLVQVIIYAAEIGSLKANKNSL